MKKFRFQLESLLRLRREEKRDAQLTVQQLRNREYQLLDKLGEVQSEHRHWASIYSQQGSGHMADRLLVENYMVALEQKQLGYRRSHNALEQKIAEAISLVELKHRACKQLEKLREKKQAEYDVEYRRREQRDIDEMVTLRFHATQGTHDHAFVG